MSNLWINLRILWWRIQIGPDWPFVRLCWHRSIKPSSGCVFCDLGLMPELDAGNGVLFHNIGTSAGIVRCGLQPKATWTGGGLSE